MKKIKKLLFVLFSVFFLVACQQSKKSGSEGLRIVTSFYPVYSITQYVSGDLNEVSMIQSDAGIHSFEPSSKDISDIESSDVFIFHSTSLENWAKNLENNLDSDQTLVVEATEGMELLIVPGLEDLETGDPQADKALYDPHSWLDPIYAGQEAQVIADALSQKDPENANIYQENADRFQEEAQDLVDRYADAFQDKKQKDFVTQHTAFYYLAQRFGLNQLGIAGISDEVEPSPKQLAEVHDYIQEKNISIIFVEKRTSSKYAGTVSQGTGAEIKILDPLEADPQNGKNLLENIEENIQQLDACLD